MNRRADNTGDAGPGRISGVLSSFLKKTKGPFWRFCLVGASGVVVDLGVYHGLLSLGIANALARAVAVGTAMTWNFGWNRRLTFPGAREGKIVTQYLRYVGANGVGGFLSWATSVGLGIVLPPTRLHRTIAALIGIGVGTASNFLLSYFWVFARRDSSTEGGRPRKDSGQGTSSPPPPL